MVDSKDETSSTASDSIGDARGGKEQDGLLHLRERHHQGRAGWAGQVGWELQDSRLQDNNL